MVFLGWQLSTSHEVALEILGGNPEELWVTCLLSSALTPGKGALLDWGMGQETRREVQFLDRKSADIIDIPAMGIGGRRMKREIKKPFRRVLVNQKQNKEEIEM